MEGLEFLSNFIKLFGSEKPIFSLSLTLFKPPLRKFFDDSYYALALRLSVCNVMLRVKAS